MARRFFTSDLHFGSTCLVENGVRHFKSVDRMNEILIKNINMRCSDDDVLIHIGDLCQRGNDRIWKGRNINPIEYIRRINPQFVNIKGNHDPNNHVISACDFMRTTLGKKYLSVSIGHYPSYFHEAKGTFRKGDVRLCGHVHDKWKYFIDFDNKVLNINVGVDAWKYNPISEDELVRYIDSIMKSKGTLKNEV